MGNSNAKQRKLGVLLSYCSIAIRNIVGLLLIPFIIQHLGVSHYGIYAFVSALAGYLIIIELGLANTVVRYLSKYQAEGDTTKSSEFLGLMLMIYGVISLIVLALGLTIWYHIDSLFSTSFSSTELSLLSTTFLILLGNVCITLISNSYTGVISAQEKFSVQQLLGIFVFIARTISIFTLLSLDFGLLTIILIDTLANSLHAFLQVVYVTRFLKVKPSFCKPSNSFLKEILIYTSFIGLNVIVNQVNWRVDNLIIGSLTNAESLGIFNVGNQLVFAFIAFASAITNVFTPTMVKQVTQGASSESLTLALIRVGRLQMVVLGAVLVMFVAYGQMFIRLFVGPLFDQAYWVALIPMIPFIFVLAQSSTNAVLQGLNKHKVRSWLLLLTAIFNVGISIVLVKYYGIVGASIGTALALFLGELILVNIYLIKVIKLNMFAFYQRLFIDCVPVILFMLGVSYYIAQLLADSWTNLVLVCAISSLLYFILTYFWTMNPQEKEQCLAWKNKFVNQKTV